MDLELRIVEARKTELERPATTLDRDLLVQLDGAADALIQGRVDLDKIAMTIVGMLAGDRDIPGRFFTLAPTSPKAR